MDGDATARSGVATAVGVGDGRPSLGPFVVFSGGRIALVRALYTGATLFSVCSVLWFGLLCFALLCFALLFLALPCYAVPLLCFALRSLFLFIFLFFSFILSHLVLLDFAAPAWGYDDGDPLCAALLRRVELKLKTPSRRQRPRSMPSSKEGEYNWRRARSTCGRNSGWQRRLCRCDSSLRANNPSF